MAVLINPYKGKKNQQYTKIIHICINLGFLLKKNYLLTKLNIIF